MPDYDKAIPIVAVILMALGGAVFFILEQIVSIIRISFG